MLAILSPILEIFNLISNVVHYLLVVSYLTGKGLYLILNQICVWIVSLFEAIGVILEELWLFVRELHVNINETCSYIENSTNRGVGGILKGITLLATEMGRFCTNGKAHSKLLASAVGRGIVKFVHVIRGSMLLIADSVWYLVTIIPRTCVNILIWMGDIVVFAISGAWMVIVHLIQAVINDLFKYITACVVIFLILRNRRRIYRVSGQWIVRITRSTISWIVRIFRFLFVLRPPRPTVRHRVLVHYNQSPTNGSSPLNKSNESNSCVVCRDRPKCVLLLPCKHLCMCEECAEFISEMRQAFCPLCRSTVHKQLSVYV